MLEDPDTARSRDTPQTAGSRVRASNVRLSPLPDFPGPRQFYPALPAIYPRLRQWVDACDVLNFRVPTPAGAFAFRLARKAGKPVFLLVVGDYIAALITLVVASLSDLLDGYLARRLKQVTRLGQILDPAADRLYIFAALVGLAANQLVPWWIVVVIVARDILLVVLGVVLANHGFGPLPVHQLGKVATFTLMTAIGFIAWGTLGYPLAEAARLESPRVIATSLAVRNLQRHGPLIRRHHEERAGRRPDVQGGVRRRQATGALAGPDPLGTEGQCLHRRGPSAYPSGGLERHAAFVRRQLLGVEKLLFDVLGGLEHGAHSSNS